MSQSSAGVGRHPPAHRTERTTIDDRETVQGVLEALTDADCRALLAASGDEPRSAAELSETCDVPLSTTYRKLDRLVEAGLLDERLRVRRSGHHETVYDRRVDDVWASIDAGGVEIRVSRQEGGRSRPADDSRRTADGGGSR